MPKDSSSLIDSSGSIALPVLPEMPKVLAGSVARLPSRWPFKVEGNYGTPGLSSSDNRSAPLHQRSSFIT